MFSDVTESMTIAQEEIFGPVLAIMRAKDFDDSMRIANNIPFALSASIQTTNVSRVFDFVYRMEAGLLGDPRGARIGRMRDDRNVDMFGNEFVEHRHADQRWREQYGADAFLARDPRL